MERSTKVTASKTNNRGEYRGLHARVHGIVQGVGFRFSAINQARRLGLTGYVRNMPDGSVEVVAEGLGEQLERLRAWLKKGPPSAVVRRVDHRYLPYSGVYGNFSVDF